MVLKFVRDQYPNARFKKMYDATNDGWNWKDFHRKCDKQGWTLTIVETNKDFIFGGFTTAEWESPSTLLRKSDPHSFLFSVNEERKYPITGGDRYAIRCFHGLCEYFGTAKANDLIIASDANSNYNSWIYANAPTFKLPAAKGWEYPSMNGGENRFQLV